MNINYKHIIQKQVLEVEMENPADAFQFRNRLGEVFHEKILPGLEILFDEIGTNDRLIRMDRLEIDLGNIETKNWENDLAEKAIQQIRQALLMENPVRQIPIKNINPTEELKEADFIEAFFFFLKIGRLPWYASNKTSFDELLIKWLNNDSAYRFKEQLKTLETVEIIRLIYQFDKQILNELIKHLIPQQKVSFYNEFIEAVNYLSSHLAEIFKNPAALKKSMYLPFFKWITLKDEIDLPTFYTKELAALLQTEFSNINHQQGFGTILGKEKNTILKKVNEFISVPVVSTFIKKDETVKDKLQGLNAEELYVVNAGLILLHPFLQPFFKEIELTKDNLFADEYARMKAVLFSQHLVYGTTIFDEHQLTLNKILCGFPIAEPIIKELEIKPEEKAATIDLLQQVIQMWQKNNVPINASMEGLQQSFLQRPGKLVQKETNWHLQVQQKPYDMLFSSLPWGIGIIKTPWMEAILRVDWA